MKSMTNPTKQLNTQAWHRWGGGRAPTPKIRWRRRTQVIGGGAEPTAQRSNSYSL